MLRRSKAYGRRVKTYSAGSLRKTMNFLRGGGSGACLWSGRSGRISSRLARGAGCARGLLSGSSGGTSARAAAGVRDEPRTCDTLDPIFARR